ncbi:hypothetical protein Pyn_34732 [Prunus yedoensis var. nudiflora]|uniref:Uncharacterized protein n=1 Tax=Prunus yedoensis var. nudiflora TaxID=2094558 RepID=A0A314UCK1_PRUYE|nr:hypothetical protein Pyn_34732 [Prunus yedoensis var. nudiflora]
MPDPQSLCRQAPHPKRPRSILAPLHYHVAKISIKNGILLDADPEVCSVISKPVANHGIYRDNQGAWSHFWCFHLEEFRDFILLCFSVMEVAELRGWGIGGVGQGRHWDF